MDNNNQQSFQFPDPPAYYKLFDKTPRALKKPNLDILYTKKYFLRFIDMQIPIDPVEIAPIESHGIQPYANFEAATSKLELATLMNEISLRFEEYAEHITDEEGLSGVFGVSQQQVEGEQRIGVIREMLINAAYFVNRLRRKQAVVKVKRELERAIEERDRDTKEMVTQIREAERIINEGE